MPIDTTANVTVATSPYPTGSIHLPEHCIVLRPGQTMRLRKAGDQWHDVAGHDPGDEQER